MLNCLVNLNKVAIVRYYMEGMTGVEDYEVTDEGGR